MHGTATRSCKQGQVADTRMNRAHSVGPQGSEGPLQPWAMVSSQGCAGLPDSGMLVGSKCSYGHL